MSPVRRLALLGAVALALLAVLLLLAPNSVRGQSANTIELLPGEYLWLPELSPRGPVLVLVSLPEQRAYVYRNGVRIGVATVSTGKPGFETPTGVFTILQKKREHYSNLYDDAPMPFMQRLTWGGVAMHAGRVPGYPASGFGVFSATFSPAFFTRWLAPSNSRIMEWCTSRSMAAMVVIGSLKIWSHFENTRLLVMSTLRRS